MMHAETTAFFLRILEFIKTWISPKMMLASPWRHFLQHAAATEPVSQDRQQMSAKRFYRPALGPPLSVPTIATTDRRAQGRRGEVCCATPPARVRYRRDATVRWSACAWSADQLPERAPLPMRRRRIAPARPW